MKKSLTDLEVKNKKVLLRVDFNVPMNNDFIIVDDTRIVEALASINYLVKNEAKVILCSHLGRPEGVVNTKLSLRPVLSRLQELLEINIPFIEDIYDESCDKVLNNMKPGEVVMLENIRFLKGEEECSKELSEKLASFADLYVFDAFATAHRKHASTYGVAKLLPNAIGFLVQKELSVFDKILTNPEHPFVAIMGGAKVSDKIPVIENLLDKVDTILIGGGMSYTFVKAIGGEVGQSLVDKQSIDIANEILEKAKAQNVRIVLPIDNYGAEQFSNTAKRKRFNSGFFSKNFQGMDIGPSTTKMFKHIIGDAKTIVWNGPMGVYEFPRFKRGTKKIAKYVAKSKAISVIGGGDTVASIQELGLTKKVTHLSTGGGASLKMLEGGNLPCVDIIDEK